MSYVYPSRASLEKRLAVLKLFPHEPYAQWEIGVLDLALRGYDALDSTDRPPTNVPDSENEPPAVSALHYEALGRKVAAAIEDLSDRTPTTIRSDAKAVEQEWEGYGDMIRAVADFLEET